MTTTDILGFARCGNKNYTIFLNGSTDGTETNTQVYTPGGVLKDFGEALAGQTLNRLALQCSDGSILSTVILYSSDGGVLLSAVGCERTSNQRYNIDLQNLSIRIEDGMLLKTNCAD